MNKTFIFLGGRGSRYAVATSKGTWNALISFNSYIYKYILQRMKLCAECLLSAFLPCQKTNLTQKMKEMGESSKIFSF
jgi:hypothetical protein